METKLKPPMPKGGITKEVEVKVPVRLTMDSARFSNGTVLMSATHATFTLPDGSDGAIYASMGGDSAEIRMHNRSWNINFSCLVDAALEAEKIYLAEVV